MSIQFVNFKDVSNHQDFIYGSKIFVKVETTNINDKEETYNAVEKHTNHGWRFEDQEEVASL